MCKLENIIEGKEDSTMGPSIRPKKKIKGAKPKAQSIVMRKEE